MDHTPLGNHCIRAAVYGQDSAAVNRCMELSDHIEIRCHQSWSQTAVVASDIYWSPCCILWCIHAQLVQTVARQAQEKSCV